MQLPLWIVVRVQYINDVIMMLCTMNKFYWCRSCAYVNLWTHHTKFIVLYRHTLRSFFVIGILYTSYKCPIMGAILYIHRCHIYFQNSELYSHALFLTILFILLIMAEKLKIASMNCRGLADKIKRLDVFNYFRKKNWHCMFTRYPYWTAECW